MDAAKDARVFSWTPCSTADDLVYFETKSRELHLGDAVVVGENQSARFIAGGKTYWFRKPGLYTIGYDERSEAEILQANIMGEKIQDMPLLVNTSLAFCNLKSCLKYKLNFSDYIMINRAVGVKPIFSMSVSVVDDAELLKHIDLDRSAEKQVREAVGKQLNICLHEQFYSLFTDYSTKDEIQMQLNDHGWMQEVLNRLLAVVACQDDFGILIEKLEIESWNLWSGFCSVCGEAVNANEGACKNRHKLYRCPVCRDLLYDGICISGGHNVMMCPECGRYVVPENGHCRTHPEVGLL